MKVVYTLSRGETGTHRQESRVKRDRQPKAARKGAKRINGGKRIHLNSPVTILLPIKLVSIGSRAFGWLLEGKMMDGGRNWICRLQTPGVMSSIGTADGTLTRL
jgi:hypothetical protein